MNIVTEIASMRNVLEDLQKRIGTRQAEGITDMDPLVARLIGRKIELERALGVIEQLQAQLKKQASAAKLGMDSAKAAGTLMMEKGQRLAAENSPEAIESEREANAILTAENESLREEVEQLRKDKQRLDALEANYWDVRYSGNAGEDVVIEIIGHYMASPCERVMGEDYSEDLRVAIDQAMKADAYPPARPEYEDSDEESHDEAMSQVRSLQAEVERLRTANLDSVAVCEQALQAKTTAEQERDRLKAAVTLAIDTFRRYEMDVETYPTINHIKMMRNLNGALAKHDADVIERAREYVTSRVEESDFAEHYDWALLEYGKKLRQQAKEVQS